MNIRLPYPPTINTYWRTSKNRTYLSAAAKSFRADVIAICWSHGKPRPLTGRLAVHVHVTMPDRRQRDLDNLLKATLDALEHAGVYENDNQIDQLRIDRGEVCAPGCVDVSVVEI